jgi:hypothetical protein
MDTTQDSYTYASLPSGSNFRILVLEPGLHDTPLCCTLRISSLDAPPYYECISYVWASSERTADLICDGERMLITPSLERVLRRVRLPDRSRTVWADAVCINQTDVEEKGRQVALMADIYRGANRTLICVGDEGSKNAELALAIFDDVNSNYLKHESADWDTLPSIDENDPILSDERWKAVKPLTEAIWFTRGWCVQEAALAKDGQILWGLFDTSWSTFMRITVWLLRRASQILIRFQLGFSNLHLMAFCLTHKEDVRPMMSASYWQNLSGPLDMFHSAREHGLTVPHDRIYALLGLPKIADWRGSKIVPDYRKSFQEVCTELACAYLETCGDLDLLLYVVHDYQALTSGCASWVPVWLPEAFPRQDIEGMYASRPPIGEPLKPLVVQDSRLQVRCMHFAEVQYVSEPLQRDTLTMDSIVELWSKVHNILLASCTPGLDRALNFAVSLTASTTRHEVVQHFQNMAAFLVELHKRSKSKPEVYSRFEAQARGGSVDMFVEWVKLMIENRRLVVSERGYALGPMGVQTGDTCTIILGTKCPFVLRGAGGKDCYRLVGALFHASEKEFEGEESGEVRGLGIVDGEDWLDWGIRKESIFLI